MHHIFWYSLPDQQDQVYSPMHGTLQSVRKFEDTLCWVIMQKKAYEMRRDRGLHGR